MADRIKQLSFARTNLNDFNVNDDTWVATDTGFLLIISAQSVSGVWYCYVSENGSVIGAMAGTQGTGGLSHSITVPVIKGSTYKLAIGGITTVATKFYDFV